MTIVCQSNSTVGEPEGVAVMPRGAWFGASGSAGVVTSFPATAESGSLSLAAVDNSGDFAGIISNAELGQATTWSLPDPGQATVNLLVDAKAAATAESAAVEINKPNGVITSESLSTSGAGTATITLTNSYIAADSVVLLQSMGGTNTTELYRLGVVPSAGSAVITIYNLTDSTAFDGTFIIGFSVI